MISIDVYPHNLCESSRSILDVSSTTRGRNSPQNFTVFRFELNKFFQARHLQFMSSRSIKTEQAVYGFIRHYIDSKDKMNIPDSIKDLCALFLSLVFDIAFKWDPYRGDFAQDTEIQGTQLKFGQNTGNFRTVLAATPISSEKYTKYEWEITLTKWLSADYNDDWCLLQMGYIDMELYTNKQRIPFADFLSGKKYEHCLNIASDRETIHVIGGTNTVHDDEVGGRYEFKKDDKYKLVFDFDTKEVIFFYNDKEIGVVFKGIAGKLVPAVNLYMCAIDCTSFKGEL